MLCKKLQAQITTTKTIGPVKNDKRELSIRIVDMANEFITTFINIGYNLAKDIKKKSKCFPSAKALSNSIVLTHQ